jgi:N-methylhydantoinase A
LHAAALARELGIPEVLIPARPGMTNALGCLVADLRQDFVSTINAPLETTDMAHVGRVLADHAARGRALNAAEGDEVIETVVQHAADMQFRGQTHLIRVPLPSATVTRDALQRLFEQRYFARFQVELPEVKAQLVNVVTSVIGRRKPFPMTALQAVTSGERRADATRPIYAGGQWHEARVVARASLSAGAEIMGPAVIEQFDATTIVEPGARARVDEIGNLRIRV